MLVASEPMASSWWIGAWPGNAQLPSRTTPTSAMMTIASPASSLKPFTYAPETACCPRCGHVCQRNEIRLLSRWAGNLHAPAKESVLVGCYICPSCPPGACWFRLEPPGFEERREYTTATRLAVVSLVRVHKMSFEGAAAVGRSLLHLPELAATTVLRWFRDDADDFDFRGHMERMVAVFSGQLAVDEVYDGGRFVIKATDPLNGVEIVSKIGDGSPTADDIRSFFLELREAGIEPWLVVTDGSSLYPDVIAEVWPEAEHQRCVFHFLMGANKLLSKAFWAAYNALPEPKKRKRGRPKKRGRPRLDKQKRADRLEVKRCRYLVFKRGGVDAKGRPRMSEAEQEALDEAIALCPALGVLRRFVEAMYELFGPTTDSHELAQQRREAMLTEPEFEGVPGIDKVLAQLADDDLFARLTRYLDFDNADKTSNHPERENREFRKRQRSHYRLRSLHSLCAFLDLLLTRREPPSEPRKLRRRTSSTEPREEVRAA